MLYKAGMQSMSQLILCINRGETEIFLSLFVLILTIYRKRALRPTFSPSQTLIYKDFVSNVRKPYIFLYYLRNYAKLISSSKIEVMEHVE